MRHDLMSKEIKVDPFGAGASLGASQQITIEGARFVKIAHRKRQMKAWTF